MNIDILKKPLKKRAIPATGSTIFFIVSFYSYIFDVDISTEHTKMIVSSLTGLSTLIFYGRNFLLLNFENNKKTLENILNRMNEKDAREGFNNKFPSVIRKEVATIMKIKSLENEDLKEVLNKGVEKAICIFTPVLTTNFNTSVDEIKTILLPKSLSVEISLLKSSICPKKKEDFASKSANITLFAIEDFILGFSKLQDSEIENGKRREAFGKLCMKMIRDIVTQSLEEYKRCE